MMLRSVSLAMLQELKDRVTKKKACPILIFSPFGGTPTCCRLSVSIPR